MLALGFCEGFCLLEGVGRLAPANCFSRLSLASNAELGIISTAHINKAIKYPKPR